MVLDPHLSVTGIVVAPAGGVLTVRQIEMLRQKQAKLAGVDSASWSAYAGPTVGVTAVASW